MKDSASFLCMPLPSMGLKHQSCRNSSFSPPSLRFSRFLISALFFTSFYLFISPLRHVPEPVFMTWKGKIFTGDLRDAKFSWNKLCFGPKFEMLKLFSQRHGQLVLPRVAWNSMLQLYTMLWLREGMKFMSLQYH